MAIFNSYVKLPEGSPVLWHFALLKLPSVPGGCGPEGGCTLRIEAAAPLAAGLVGCPRGVPEGDDVGVGHQEWESRPTALELDSSSLTNSEHLDLRYLKIEISGNLRCAFDRSHT